MAKKLYTAKDIISLVREQHLETLVLGKGDLVTPMARDTAREYGLQIVEVVEAAPNFGSIPSAEVKPVVSDLEARVRKIVTAMVGQTANSVPEKSAVALPVIHVDGRSLTMPAFPFEIHRPEMDVRLEDVVTQQHGSPIAAGLMSFHKGNFPWTLNYDEVDYIIEGELHIGTPQGTVVGKPGDVLYIPKGSSITFGTPSWTKFFYVTYPAEWAG
jgi:ethanolamine utilization protein EutQ